jgi:subtilase family serine protease
MKILKTLKLTKLNTVFDRSLRSIAAGLVLTLSLLAPGVRAQAPIAVTTSPAGQPVPSVLNGSAQLVGPYNTNQTLRLVLGLQPPNLAEERQLIAALHDKTSPQFHHFLTADEWIARFAPSAQDEQAVVNWAQSAGLTVTNRYPNRLLVDVAAPVSAIEKALNITINSYAVGTTTFFSNDRAPVIPANLTGIVHSVGGLNNLQVLQPANKNAREPVFPVYAPGPVVSYGPSGGADATSAAPSTGSKKGAGIPDMTDGAYDPSDIYSYQAYNFGWPYDPFIGPSGLYKQGHCCNPFSNPSGTPPQTSIAIATAGTQQTSDFYGFHDQYTYLAEHWAGFTYIDGTPSCCDEEGTMDFEWSTAMSNSFGSEYATAEIYMYDGVNANFSTFTDIYNQILTDGTTRVMSTSWGCAENSCYDPTDMDTADYIFTQMVGEGWTLVAASGDQGATAGCGDAIAVQFPSSDPNVVGAGGTTMTLASGPIFGSAVAWSGGPAGCAANDGGSTGGFSAYWATPSYQSPLGFGSRAVPDIALNADWYHTPQNIYFEGSLSGNGGTSIVAPQMAGFFAQENAYLLTLGNICGSGASACSPMGNANYYLYLEGIYQTAPHYPFYDITSGCNNNDVTALYGLGYYCAGPGYDEVTGWGSANMLQLAWAINWFSTPAFGSPSVTFSGPPVNQWYNTDQTVSWTVADNGGGYTPTGVAGFTQGWDSIPSDPYSEATPGTGNSFYSGPEYANATAGCLDLTGATCAGSVSQGCHTAYVEAWNNMGVSSGGVAYGPICYDTIAPVTTATLSGTLSGSAYVSPVKVTLTATDSGSGVASTVYQINGGAVTTYSAPFTVSAAGSDTVTFHSTDKAGNVESTKTVSFTIDASTTTSVVSSLNPSTYETAVTFTATVTSTSGSPTGTVTFKDSGTSLGTGTLSGGKATYTILTLTAGAHSITAVYAGSGTFITSTSAVLTQTVNKAGSSTTLTSSANPSSYLQTVTFTATVKSATSGTPAGTVTFNNGTTVLGTGTLNGSGVATLATSSLALGSHPITASYSGGSNFNTSVSATLTQTVNKENTTTAVVSSLNPSVSGQTVTFTATVTPAFGGSPAGTVTFSNGTTVLGTGTLSSTTHKATFATSTLSVGAHSITAAYSGGPDVNGSTSPTLTQTVNAAGGSTTTALTSSANPSSFLQTVTFTATVKSTSTGTPTGTVTFKNGTTVLGTGTLNSSGVATLATSSLTIGSHAMTASYSGDTHFNASVSGTLTQTVNKANTTTAVVSSLNPSVSGQTVTFTATVTPAFGGSPNGTVTFSNGTTVLGTGTLNSSTRKATFATSTLSVGAHSITAAYSGGPDLNGSTSPKLTQTVNP